MNKDIFLVSISPTEGILVDGKKFISLAHLFEGGEENWNIFSPDKTRHLGSANTWDDIPEQYLKLKKKNIPVNKK